MPATFPGGSDGKEAACNAGNRGSVPGQRDPLEKGMSAHSSLLAWRIPQTEEPGSHRPCGHKESNMTEQLSLTHTDTHTKTHTQTHTETQIHRQHTHTQTQRHTNRHTYKGTHTDTHTDTETQATHRHTHRHAYKDTQTHTQRHRDTGDTQTHTQTQTQTHTHTHTHNCPPWAWSLEGQVHFPAPKWGCPL